MSVLEELASVIESRRTVDPSTSWTAKLLADGPQKCAEKFGEEAIEAVIAAAAGDRENLRDEAADVLYHLLVMLAARDVAFGDVLETLRKRQNVSGIAEKASRK